MSDAYDMIDRFLRNNLGDDDYAEFSAALDSLHLAQPAQAAPTTRDPFLRERQQLEQEWSELRRLQAQYKQAVPMTDEQINAAYGEARVQNDHIPHDDVARIARAVERHHGIVGKEGA